MAKLSVMSKFLGECVGIGYPAIMISGLGTLLAITGCGSSPLTENVQTEP